MYLVHWIETANAFFVFFAQTLADVSRDDALAVNSLTFKHVSIANDFKTILPIDCIRSLVVTIFFDVPRRTQSMTLFLLFLHVLLLFRFKIAFNYLFKDWQNTDQQVAQAYC